MGLTAFYHLWVSTHLVKKIMAWTIFQASIVLLWFSTSSLYHGRGNPIPLVIVFLISIFSIGIFGIMLIFALGVLRRQGSWKIENKNSKRPV
jgi:multisubunit Na+/H+ antiporter MnhC subunit